MEIFGLVGLEVWRAGKGSKWWQVMLGVGRWRVEGLGVEGVG